MNTFISFDYFDGLTVFNDFFLVDKLSLVVRNIKQMRTK